MKVILHFAFLLFAVAASGQSKKEIAIKEIRAAENAFNEMAQTKGLQEAFTSYAAPDVIIKRGNDSLIYGKAGVSEFYAKDVFKKASLTWAPDFADASEAGDMGYTVGKYHWLLKGEDGNTVSESRGIFHTVWKRQPDGSWKFVWD